MSKPTYAFQLEQLYNVGDLTDDCPMLRLLVQRIEQDPPHAFLLKSAAALLHAQEGVRAMRKNIYVMRKELKGQLIGLGIKEWRVGIR